MSNVLLYLGANELQLAALRFAREAGLEVVVVDPDPQAAGRRYADRFAAHAPADVEGVAELARSLGKRLAAACASSDDWLAAAAAAHEAARIPGPTRATLARGLEPRARLAAWKEHGVCASTRHEADAGARVVSVEGFFRDGVYVPGGIGERFGVSAACPAGERGSVPAEMDPAERGTLHDLVERGARALDLVQGPVCARVQLSANGPELLALTPRFDCGAFTAHTTAFAYGKSPLQAWFAALAEAGGPFDGMPSGPERSAGWLAVRAAREGVLRSVEGAERARSLPGCERVLRLLPAGAKVRPADGERAWVAIAFASGKDALEVEERLSRIRSRMEVKLECRSVA
jgi:hypothetical protein